MDSSEDEVEREKRLTSQRKRRINIIKRTSQANAPENPTFRPSMRFEDGTTFSEFAFNCICERKQRQTGKARTAAAKKRTRSTAQKE